MHKFIFTIALVAAMTASFSAAAQQQESQLPDPMEMAAKMADQLEKELDLDIAQVFKVDTLFQHVYSGYYEEVDKLAKAGVPSNSSQYIRASDIWGRYADDKLQQMLTEEQWAKYLKTDAGRNKKRRDKRLEENKY